MRAGSELESLRSTVSETLGVELTAADDDCNLFELGLQSMSLMRLATRLKAAGTEVSFTQLSEDPRLSAWAALVSKARAESAGEPGTGADAVVAVSVAAS